MQPKQTLMLGAALAVIAVAVVLMVRRMGPSPEEQDPIATWVCDSCGQQAKAPLENKSVDCAKCTEGQLVQRVYFKCKKCSETFEAYQVNWSPTAPRADAKCTEADRSGRLPEGVKKEEAQLVRRPGGTWAWRDAAKGRKIARELACPTCGKAKYGNFEKVLDPESE